MCRWVNKSYGKGVIQTSNTNLIQAAREIASTLARAPNVTYLPGGKEQNLLLGIGTR